MPSAEKGLPQIIRPPKASLVMRWLWASTNPRTSPLSSVPRKGSPVTLTSESTAGRWGGSHQGLSAATVVLPVAVKNVTIAINAVTRTAFLRWCMEYSLTAARTESCVGM